MGTAVCNPNNDIRPGEMVRLEKITPLKVKLGQFWENKSTSTQLNTIKQH